MVDLSQNFQYSLEDKEARLVDVYNNHHHFTSLNQANTYGILYSKGQFDDWCTYVIKPDDRTVSHSYAVSDKYYFERIYWLGTLNRFKLTMRRVYGHLLHIYELVQNSKGAFNTADVDEIIKLCWEFYPSECRDIAIEAFILVYYGMVAEESNKSTKLGAMIKMYGLHQLLIEQKPVESAVTCLRGQNAASIKDLCDELGIVRIR